MKRIIKKWYDALNFPEEYADNFNGLIESAKLTPCTIGEYKSTGDFKKDLLMSLYFCEETEDKAKKRGLPYRVLLETLSDISAWTKAYWHENNDIGLLEYNWISLGLNLKLHKLGRLEFMPSADKMEVHIPTGEPLICSECLQSLKMSAEFFGRYYPDYEYETYCTYSWLLDDTLEKFLKKDSNILRFAKLFKTSKRKESDAALRYVFGWNATRENLHTYKVSNDFMQKMYDYIMMGGKLYEVYGEIKKTDIAI